MIKYERHIVSAQEASIVMPEVLAHVRQGQIT